MKNKLKYLFITTLFIFSTMGVACAKTEPETEKTLGTTSTTTTMDTTSSIVTTTEQVTEVTTSPTISTTTSPTISTTTSPVISTTTKSTSITRKTQAITTIKTTTEKTTTTTTTTKKPPASTETPVPSNALAFAKELKVGWNLGNTFDAYECSWLSNKLDYESAWCGVKTTKAMIDSLKAQGFKSIRIPVSWHDHVDANYKIDAKWLSRVKEVVDYAVANDMYIILNTHHDETCSMGKNSDEAPDYYLYPSGKKLANSKKYLTTVWTQIANEFKNYNNKLIFESMNEPRLKGTSCEWNFQTSCSTCKDSADAINKLNQAFVDTVRATGGNNKTRYLMVPGYSASPDGATNSLFKLPTDSASNKIMVSVHAYTPYSFALNNNPSDQWYTTKFTAKSEIDSFINKLNVKYISKGIPVVIGEFGALDKNNLSEREAFAQYYVKAAAAKGIPCLWWDNNAFSGDGEKFGLLDRKTVTFKYPTIVKALISNFK